MIQDKFGLQIYSESELVDIFYTNPDVKFKKCYVRDNITFDKSLDIQDEPKLIPYKELDISIEEFDQHNQNNWYIPEKYKTFDIAKFVLEQCNTDAELQRAGQELLLYQEKGLFPLLQYLKYLVDVMRENNIVWGVGRGSSTSSFVLYLIGIHKINSLYYDLSVEEFLK